MARSLAISMGSILYQKSGIPANPWNKFLRKHLLL